MKIVRKSSVEIIPQTISFKNDLVSGETVSSHTVTCVESSTGVDSAADIILAHSNDTQGIILSLRAGVDQAEYIITGSVLTSFGNTYTQSFVLWIIDPAADLYTKFSPDNFVIAVDYSWDIMESIGESIAGISVTASNESGTDVLASLITETGYDTSRAFLRVADGAEENFYVIRVLATTSLGFKYLEIIHLRVAANA